MVAAYDRQNLWTFILPPSPMGFFNYNNINKKKLFNNNNNISNNSNKNNYYNYYCDPFHFKITATSFPRDRDKNHDLGRFQFVSQLIIVSLRDETFEVHQIKIISLIFNSNDRIAIYLLLTAWKILMSGTKSTNWVQCIMKILKRKYYQKLCSS